MYVAYRNTPQALNQDMSSKSITQAWAPSEPHAGTTTYSSSHASDAMTQPATSTKESNTPQDDAAHSPRSSPSSRPQSRTPSRPATGTLRMRGSLDPVVQEAWASAVPGGGHMQGAVRLEDRLQKAREAQALLTEDEDWEEDMVIRLLGEEDAYGYSPVRRSHGPLKQPLEQTISEEQDSETDSVFDQTQPTVAVAPGGEDDADAPAKTPYLLEDDEQEDDAVRQGLVEAFWAWAQNKRDVLHGIVMVLIRLFMRGERAPRHAVPILITPIKRMEREANKSSKRVHFKLRKKAHQEAFSPLAKGSVMVQSWLMFMVVPLVLDVFAFGLRLAFCDIFLHKFLLVYYMDVTCDVIKVCMCVC